MSLSRPITAAVLTCSDRCARGETVDRSGPALVEILQKQLSAQILAAVCLPDEKGRIAQQLSAALQ